MRSLGFCVAIATVGMVTMPLLARAGQKDAGLPPSAAPPPPTETLGFGEATNRMTVPVQVDGRGPYSFIIDTGAERSVVSRELAATLGLDAGAKARLFDFAGMSMVSTVKVPSLSAGTLSTAAMEAPSLDAANLGASGMLGIDALQGHRVVIDFDRKRMMLAPAKKHPRGEALVGTESRAGQLLITQARFNGQPIVVIIDTGTWVSVGNKAMLALAKKKPRAVGPITIWSVTGKSVRADYVAVDNLSVGSVNFNNFGLSFADLPPFERLGLMKRPALILGMSSLKLFRRVEIDFANREIAFTLPRPPIDFATVCRAVSNCKSY